MGTQLSKSDQHLVPSSSKPHSHDDSMSKSTEDTVDSSASSPTRESLVHSRSNVHSQGWRKGGSSRSMPRLPPHSFEGRRARDERQHPSEVPSLQRRDSDPFPPSGSRAIPVKPQKSSTKHDSNASSSPEGEDTQYLMRMYDSRTWEMYRRITESRKNSNFCYANDLSRDNRPLESTAAWENLQHDYGDSSEGEHQMIFLFDFD